MLKWQWTSYSRITKKRRAFSRRMWCVSTPDGVRRTTGSVSPT